MPGRRGLEALSARDARALWVLMLLVGVLLLIVCANVANLLLSRCGRQAARVRRPPGTWSGTHAALPAASDREWHAGAARRRCRSGVGIRARPIHPSSVSNGARCEQCLRPPSRSARAGIHRGAVDSNGAPLWPRAGGARLARRPRRHAQGADAIGDGWPFAPAAGPGLDPDRAVPGRVGSSRVVGPNPREPEMDRCRVRPGQPGIRVREPLTRRLFDRARGTIYRSRARSASQAARRRRRKPRLDAIAVWRWEQRPRELSWTPLGRCEPIEPEYGWRRVLRNAAHASRSRQDVRTPRHAAERRRGGRRPGVCSKVLPERESAGPPLWTRPAEQQSVRNRRRRGQQPLHEHAQRRVSNPLPTLSSGGHDPLCYPRDDGLWPSCRSCSTGGRGCRSGGPAHRVSYPNRVD